MVCETNMVYTDRVQLKGVDVDVEIHIDARGDLTTNVFFSFGKKYMFRITERCIPGWTNIITKMIDHYGNGPYGERDAAGTLAVTTQQKKDAVRQAVRDIFVTLDRIMTVHERAVMGYAIWYSKNCGVVDNYSKFITLVTCNCIIQSEFITPDVAWELVEF